jgi:hypothetical protein
VQVNISLVVPEAREREAVAALHKCFFEDSCEADFTAKALVDEQLNKLALDKQMSTAP